MAISIKDYAERNGLQVKFNRTHPSVFKGWSASLDLKGDRMVEFKDSKDDPTIGAECGTGLTKTEALNNLCLTIRGKVLVIQDYGGGNRTDKLIPTNLQTVSSLST